MAFVKENDLTEGISGRVGNKLVFRTRNGKTVVAIRPQQSTTDPNDKQVKHRERFKRAAQYAKLKMADAVAKAYYQSRVPERSLGNAFAEALGDYMTDPKILGVDVLGFTGASGSVIPITVDDNLKVIAVRVVIRHVDNSLAESGVATLAVGDTKWKYTTTTTLAATAGVKITVTAVDRPGNETPLETTLS